MGRVFHYTFQSLGTRSKFNLGGEIEKRACKHAVGLAIRLKEIKVSEEAKSIPIGSKRERKRPKKAKPTLFRD